MSENNIKMGDFFYIEGIEYILAQTSAYEFCLICLDGGNRWKDPIKLDAIKTGGNGFEIKKEDLEKLYTTEYAEEHMNGDTFETFYNSKHEKEDYMDKLFTI